MKRIAIISSRASDEIKNNLVKRDILPVEIPPTDRVSAPITGHPDIQLFVYGNNIFCHPDIDRVFLTEIAGYFEVIVCKTSLSPEYPGDIPYNILTIGTMAFHKFPNTDPQIKNFLMNNYVCLNNVPQGYTRCSALPVGADSIITPDAAIHEAALSSGIRSLRITPGFVDLPGYSYGFIGGAGGCVQNDIFLSGHLEGHPDCDLIMEFFEKAEMTVHILSKDKIIDLGSFFIIDSDR